MHTIPAPQPLILRMLYRHRAIVVLLPLLFGILASIVLAILPDRYEAFGLVEVTPQPETLSLKPYAPPVLPNDSMVLSEVEIIRSPAVIKKVAQEMKLPASFVQSVIDVRPIGRSYIIRISAKTPQAAVSRDIVNTLILAYQKTQITGKILHADKKADWLNQHLSQLNKKLHDSSEQIEQYRAEKGLFDSQRSDVVAQQITQLSAELIDAQATEAALLAKSETVLEKDAVSAQLDSSVISALSQDETRLREELAILQQKYGPKHPKLQSTKAALSALQSKRYSDIQRIKNGIREEKAQATAHIKKIQDQLDLLKDQQQQENTVSISLHELERKDKINRILYENFLRQSREIDLMDGMQQADSRIVSLADLPTSPINRHTLVIIFLSSIAGFFISCFAVILAEQLRQTINDPYILQDMTPESRIHLVDFRYPDPQVKTDAAILPFLQHSSGLVFLVYVQKSDKAYTQLYASYVLQQLHYAGRTAQIGTVNDISSAAHNNGITLISLAITDVPAHLGNSTHLVIREGFTSQYHLHLALRLLGKAPEIVYLWT